MDQDHYLWVTVIAWSLGDISGNEDIAMRRALHTHGRIALEIKLHYSLTIYNLITTQ